MAASRGRRRRTRTSPPDPSAPSPWRRPIPTSSTSARASRRFGAIFRPATGCIARPMPGRRGSRSASPTPVRSRTSPCIRGTPTSCTSRSWAMRSRPTPRAACSARRTAAKRGRVSSSRTTARGRSTSRWTPPTRASCTRASGRRSAGRGSSCPVDQAAGSGSRPMAGTHGRTSPGAAAFQRVSSARSASRSRP